MEEKPHYTTNPDLLTRLLAVLEDWQWARVIFHLSNIIDGTGWGEVHISIRNGRLDEIAATMRDKPRKNQENC